MVIGIEASRANKKEKTGTEWYAYELIRTIARIDRDDELLLYTNTALQPSLSALGPNVSERILRWPPKRLWNQLRLSLEMLQHKPDVLFLPAHTIPIVHPQATVTTLHDVGFDRAPELYARHELAYHRWAVRFALRHAKKIVVPSTFTKSEILALYPQARGRDDDLVVIHHGFDGSRYHPEQNLDRQKAVLERFHLQRPFFLYVGRLQEKKNVPRLVEAYALFRQQHPESEVDLVLAGQPDFGFERIQQILIHHALGDFVHFPGYVTGDDLPVLMAAARAFVFPSLYEGFGIPVLEAQSSGTPVVTSSVASLPEVGGSGALYVDPTSTEEIAGALGRIAADEILRADLRENGFFNLRRFSWERCANQTIQVLRNS